MISVVNGYDVDARQSVRDKWDLTEFLKKNKVKVVDGFVKKKEMKRGFNDAIRTPKLRGKLNADTSFEFNKRKQKQFTFLAKYDEKAVGNKWANLVRMSGTAVSTVHISRTAKGNTTIVCPIQWGLIEKAIIDFLGESNEKN